MTRMQQSLSQRLGQQLHLTPQMHQAMRLLQLSALELRQELREALESNPMLEEDGLEDGDLEAGEALDAQEDGDAQSAAADEGDGESPGAELDLDAEAAQPIPEELPVDSSWDDIFPAPATPDRPLDEGPDLAERNGAEQTLRDHLHWQLNLTPMSKRDRLLATAIIDAVNPDGMLDASVDELRRSFGAQLQVETDELLVVLKRVQRFDPPGVAARDLAECLALQLEALDPAPPRRDAALALVREHLDLLAARDFAALKRKSKLDEAALAETAALIQSLNPRPGAALAPEPRQHIIPDLAVRKEGGRWRVELNAEALPAIRIHAGYASLVRRRDGSRDNQYLRDNLQEARWLLKGLQSRHETLLQVAAKIVELQQGFLERGEEAMRPLARQDVADALGLHDSTVSRATSRKYMQTPRGLFELRRFFSNQVGQGDDALSSAAIRARIGKLIAQENPAKPLSDSRIAALLAERNIEVARRTVAKYREALAIPPSNRRKRLT